MDFPNASSPAGPWQRGPCARRHRGRARSSPESRAARGQRRHRSERQPRTDEQAQARRRWAGEPRGAFVRLTPPPSYGLVWRTVAHKPLMGIARALESGRKVCASRPRGWLAFLSLSVPRKVPHCLCKRRGSRQGLARRPAGPARQAEEGGGACRRRDGGEQSPGHMHAHPAAVIMRTRPVYPAIAAVYPACVQGPG